LTKRFGVMLRAAMNDSGKAIGGKQRADKGHDDGLPSLIQTSPCCHSALLTMLSHHRDRLDRSGSIRSPEMASAITSPKLLPQIGRIRIEPEVLPAEETRRTLTSYQPFRAAVKAEMAMTFSPSPALHRPFGQFADRP
jgi:hypothetical protein